LLRALAAAATSLKVARQARPDVSDLGELHEVVLHHSWRPAARRSREASRGGAARHVGRRTTVLPAGGPHPKTNAPAGQLPAVLDVALGRGARDDGAGRPAPPATRTFETLPGVARQRSFPLAFSAEQVARVPVPQSGFSHRALTPEANGVPGPVDYGLKRTAWPRGPLMTSLDRRAASSRPAHRVAATTAPNPVVHLHRLGGSSAVVGEVLLEHVLAVGGVAFWSPTIQADAHGRVG